MFHDTACEKTRPGMYYVWRRGVHQRGLSYIDVIFPRDATNYDPTPNQYLVQNLHYTIPMKEPPHIYAVTEVNRLKTHNIVYLWLMTIVEYY